MDGRIDRVIYPKVVMADNNKILVSQSVGLVHHYRSHPHRPLNHHYPLSSIVDCMT